MDGNGLHYAPQGNHYPNHPSSLGQSHSRSNATPPPQMAGRRLSRSSNPTITTTSRFQPGGAASNPAGAPYQAHNHPQQQPTFAPHGGPPPADPHAYYQPPPPAQLPTFGPGPLPLFPTIATNRQRLAQAMHSSYPSRLRTGVSTLMQPIIPLTSSTAASGAGGLTKRGRASGMVSYTETGFDDDDDEDDDDEEPAEPADGSFGSRRGATTSRRQTNMRKDAPPPAKKGSDLSRSFLGEMPPAEKVTIQRITKTKYDYPTEEQLNAAAQIRDVLIPIRIDLDTDTHRIRDCFTWNLNESLFTPEQFAKIFCHDIDIPPQTYSDTITAQIKAQLEEYASVAEMGVGYDDDHSGEVYIRPVEVIPEKPKDKRNRDSKKRKEAKRRKAMLEAAARGERLKTAEEEAEQKQREQEQREAEAAAAAAAEEEAGTSTPGRQADDQDIEMTEEPSQQQQQQAGTPQQQQESMVNSPAPQQAGEEGTAKEGGAEPEKSAAEVAAVEGEVEVESDCRIIVNLDVQIATLNLRDRIEWDLASPLTPEDFAQLLCQDLGLTGESLPLIAHAIHEELLRHKKDAIEAGLVGAGWSRTERDRGNKGAKRLEGVWRGWEEQEDFAPVLLELSVDDIEKREIERERATRRMRRETARFATNTSNARFRRR